MKKNKLSMIRHIPITCIIIEIWIFFIL
jgi:hypothetical protein